MPNPNTILMMNMEMKDCDQARHDHHLEVLLSLTTGRGSIIVSALLFIFGVGGGHVAVMYKQVVVVKQDTWMQVKDVLQEGNIITVGLGLEGLKDKDMGIKYDYTEEASIADDALGIVLSNKGQFIHRFQITKRIISTHTKSLHHSRRQCVHKQF